MRKLIAAFGLALALGATGAPAATAAPTPPANPSPSASTPATSPVSHSPSVTPSSTPQPSSSSRAEVPVSPGPSRPSKRLAPTKRQELKRLLEQRSGADCEIPENISGNIVGCFRDAPYERVASRAPGATMPNCPAPEASDAIHWTRTYSCSHVKKIGTFAQVQPTKFLGTASSNYAWEEWLDPKSARAWKRTVYYQNLYVTGELVPDLLTTTLSIGCTTGGCGTPAPVTFAAKKGIVQTHTHFMESPGSGVAYPNPQTKIEIAYPGAKITGLDKYLGPPTGVRCDSLTDVTRSKKPGCVYHWYTPVYEVDYNGPMPTIAQNILFGQLGLRSHAGFPGNSTTPGGQPLVRGPARYTYKGVDKEFSRWSREVSCPGSLIKPPGQSCDEYPFASTWNGAHWVGADEWTCRFVPIPEQDYQAIDIQDFTDNNRVWRNPDGKTVETTGAGLQGSFWVAVKNAPSTPPSFNQCQKHM
ncbi:NucA/NucB deoxyribonuclease domain-containing protein [Actinomadura hibisca]|uniref:NucA/NucB deoxyribonuclease domain-containing protein n=1 Tax=Actinomadura hibisca TaxID=68565 RepID=UPI000AD2F07D|nr:hypothetical protein [Actinomadura hibisca]